MRTVQYSTLLTIHVLHCVISIIIDLNNNDMGDALRLRIEFIDSR